MPRHKTLTNRRPAPPHNVLSFSIIFTNIRSLLPKRELISNIMSSSGSNILILTETWLNSDVTDTEILADLPNFEVYRNDRKGKRGAVFSLPFIEAYHALLLTSHPTLKPYGSSVALPRNSSAWRLLQAPQTNPDFPRHLNNILHKLVFTYPNARILLFGDFNYPDIDWQNIASSTITCHAEAKNFIDVCLNFNLTQLISQPTRVSRESANTLDLILTSSPENVSSINYLPEISDHKVMHALFSFTSTQKQTSDKTIQLYDKGNYNAITEELNTFFLDTYPHFTLAQFMKTG